LRILNLFATVDIYVGKNGLENDSRRTSYDSEVNSIDFEDAGIPETVPFSSR